MRFSEGSTPRWPGAKRRMGLLGGTSKLLGTPVTAAIPLQRHPPAAVLGVSTAEIAGLLLLMATGSPAAMVVLLALSAVLVILAATNTRRVLALTRKGNVVLAASARGWPEAVVGPAPRELAIPEPVGLGVSIDIAGTTWWVDRSSFRSLRRAKLTGADGSDEP